MAFWNTPGNQDPKRNFRFKVLFTGIAANETHVWWAKKINKPNFTVAEGKHVYLGHTFYYPGKLEWQTISMTLVDPVTPGALKAINEAIHASGYDGAPAEPNDVITMNKPKATAALGNIQILQIDGEGNSTEQWTLFNPFIKKVAFSDLDYENDDLSTIDLELRYDWAQCDIFKDGGTNDGQFFIGS